MKTFATVLILSCVAGALSGCGMAGHPMMGHGPGRTVSFVASNPESVLVDFAARPPGELTYASNVADQQCGMFGRRGATLESLNTRSGGLIRGTYLCRK